VVVRIHSTLTGCDEELVPIHSDGVLRMYVCGMTPKFHPHVGHARTFVAMDIIRRYLEYRGYRLKYVQNFTDIDDKIIARAALEDRDTQSTAQEYIASYLADMDRLNVQRADEYPTVTGYMERIVEFIAGLVEGDHAYVVDGDVYFAVNTFPDYGKLSHRDLNSQLVAARKELEPSKRDPRDFALWKRAKPDEPSWPSPWGRGRPGWHIECSAMVRETLGDQIDIHGGGADLIFPHHENEIAQSESLTGRVPFTAHWAHSGLVTIEGEKMAHSLENFFTIESVLERYPPNAIRLYLTGTHYRSPLSFAIAADGKVRGIEDARSALGRLRRALGPEPLALEGELDGTAMRKFTDAMDADFNTPDALAVIFDTARDINRARDANTVAHDIDTLRRTVVRMLAILGIDLGAGDEAPDGQSELPARLRTTAIGPFVELLLDVRRDLRANKHWALADQVRDRLGELGVVVEDKPDGGSGWHLADGR
jgi:cysteinyl-tRNA synthetase